MHETKKVKVRKSFWLTPDGTIDVDEKIQTEVSKIVIDNEMRPLIHGWRQLKQRTKKARYDGFRAYALFSRKPKESELILNVMFFHPGPDFDTPLPEEKIESIKSRARKIAALVRAQGIKIDDDDPQAEAISEFWVTMPDPASFEKILDEFVRLSIEFGLEEYLWDHRDQD